MDDDKKLEIQELGLRDMVSYIKKLVFSLIKRKPSWRSTSQSQIRLNSLNSPLRVFFDGTFCIVYVKD